MKEVFSGKLKENQDAQYDKDGHSKRESCSDNSTVTTDLSVRLWRILPFFNIYTENILFLPM